MEKYILASRIAKQMLAERAEEEREEGDMEFDDPQIKDIRKKNPPKVKDKTEAAKGVSKPTETTPKGKDVPKLPSDKDLKTKYTNLANYVPADIKRAEEDEVPTIKFDWDDDKIEGSVNVFVCKKGTNSPASPNVASSAPKPKGVPLTPKDTFDDEKAIDKKQKTDEGQIWERVVNEAGKESFKLKEISSQEVRKLAGARMRAGRAIDPTVAHLTTPGEKIRANVYAGTYSDPGQPRGSSRWHYNKAYLARQSQKEKEAEELARIPSDDWDDARVETAYREMDENKSSLTFKESFKIPDWPSHWPPESEFDPSLLTRQLRDIQADLDRRRNSGQEDDYTQHLDNVVNILKSRQTVPFSDLYDPPSPKYGRPAPNAAVVWPPYGPGEDPDLNISDPYDDADYPDPEPDEDEMDDMERDAQSQSASDDVDDAKTALGYKMIDSVQEAKKPKLGSGVRFKKTAKGKKNEFFAPEAPEGNRHMFSNADPKHFWAVAQEAYPYEGMIINEAKRGFGGGRGPSLHNIIKKAAFTKEVKPTSAKKYGKNSKPAKPAAKKSKAKFKDFKQK